MIRFEEVYERHLGEIDFRIEPGTSTVIITGSVYQSERLVRIMAALERPDRGSVTVLGREVHALDEDVLLAHMKRIGIVWRLGGIISNLKVWENVVLPSRYHDIGLSPDEEEARARQVYERAGREGGTSIDEFMAMRPGALPDHDKVLVGIMCAMLMEPELMIYETVFETLGHSGRRKCSEMLMEYHREKEGRTSVFVASSSDYVSHIEADEVITIGRSG